MRAQQVCIDMVANNLANVNTNGFKASQANFEDLLYDELIQPGAEAGQGFQVPTGLQIGSGVRLVGSAKLFTQGELEQTGRDLDLCIQGRGFFQVTMPDGTRAYSRDGAFGLDGQRRLVTADGKPLADDITLPADVSTITVAPDGKVYARVSNATADTLVGQIQLASFANSGGLRSVGGNLFVESVASGAPTLHIPGQEGVGELRQGYLERSNVDVVAELVRLITAQRAYEINTKTITISDHMLQTSNGLVR
jgi:flagellar basal-body rod protein FlgG